MLFQNVIWGNLADLAIIHFNALLMCTMLCVAGYCQSPSTSVVYNHENQEPLTTYVVSGSTKVPAVDLLEGSDEPGESIPSDGSSLEIIVNEDIIKSPFKLMSMQLTVSNVQSITISFYGPDGGQITSATVCSYVLGDMTLGNIFTLSIQVHLRVGI